MPWCLIKLPLLDEATEARLDRYLEMCARERDRPALKELYRRLVEIQETGVWPTSPAELFNSTKSPTNKLFSDAHARSELARARTAGWSEIVIREPALITSEAVIVDLAWADWSGGGGWVAKLGMVLGPGVQPIETTRTYRADQRAVLVVRALRRLRDAGHDVPIITARPEPELVELLLHLAVRVRLQWTGRVSSQFTFPGSLNVRWLGDLPMQTLSIADTLAARPPAEQGAPGAFAWAQINRDRRFLLYGPSRRAHYYIRHCQEGMSGDRHQREMLRLVDMIESRELSLSDYRIEDLKILAKNEDAYERLTRGMLLMWRFALHAPAVAADNDAGNLDIPETS